nr:hypothetical protein [uncultured Draconibacterium sp.]
MDKYYSKYIDNKKAIIRVICRTRQWSGLNESDVFDWLDNFLDPFGKYVALKILLNSIYYSEKNIIALLKHGIYQKIIGEEIKCKLINDDAILAPRTETNSLVFKSIQKTAFIPLLDNYKPGESGNQMTRYLIQNRICTPEKTYFIENLSEPEISELNTLVFLDDCIGSGNQLEDYFDKIHVREKLDFACRNGVRVYYLILTGYNKNIATVQMKGKMKDIEIVACDELSEIDRIFNQKNIIWHDDDEYCRANEYFEHLEKEFGINQYGYSNLDFAVFIHNNVPDWSLPIFWMENSDWTPLMKRKNSTQF